MAVDAEERLERDGEAEEEALVILFVILLGLYLRLARSLAEVRRLCFVGVLGFFRDGIFFSIFFFSFE